MNLRLGNCCGTCKHLNRASIPNTDATYLNKMGERWCFKHLCYTSVVSICDSYKAVKIKFLNKLFNSINTYNTRIEKINIILPMIKEEIVIGNRTYFVKNNWLFYRINNSSHEFGANVKEDEIENNINDLYQKLNINNNES